MSIASDRPYERFWGLETLEITPQAIRSERLDAGAPILIDHNSSDLVGVLTAGRSPATAARVGRLLDLGRGQEFSPTW
jgi:hypothetical protein